MNFAVVLTLSLLPACFSKAPSESNSLIENGTQPEGRSNRNEYSSLVYSPPDNYASRKSNLYKSDVAEEDAFGFEPKIEPRLSKAEPPPSQAIPMYSPSRTEEYEPINYYISRNHLKPRNYELEDYVPRGNGKAWKGDHMDGSATSGMPMPDNKGAPQPPMPDFSEYYFPADNWKGDPWTPDQFSKMMMMMNQMQAMNKPKFGGVLSRILHDPAMLLIIASFPISILLAMVLPTLMNMMMNGGLPTITTTATGNNNARTLESIDFLRPVIQTITAFDGRSFENPECMQKLFCQVTKGPITNGTEARSFQKALYSASKLIDTQWLDSFGVKTLFDSMEDGNCDKIPCPTYHSPKTDGNKKT